MTARALVLAAAVLVALPARSQVGIDLSEPEPKKQEPEQKKEEKKQEKKLPPERARPLDSAPAAPALRSGRTEGEAFTGPLKDRLAAAAGLGPRRAEEAALAYDAILRDPAAGEAHGEARLGLAGALARLGLTRSAISYYGDLLAGGTRSPQLDRAAAALFDLSAKSDDEQAVLAQVGRLEGAQLGGGAEDELHYLLAKYVYERALALEQAGRKDEARRGYDEARRHAALVKGGGSGARGDAFARARFLDGLAQYAQGNANGALEAFKEVVRLTNPRRTAAADERLRELAFLQLARLHYEHRQNRYALFYYGRMPQGGESWLESVWESSYAYYRIGDSERALGNLITLHSPYFKDEWFPESYLLNAIIYYENCRYPEARAIIEDFERGFDPVYQALGRVAGRDEPPETFLTTALAGGHEGSPALSRRIARLALADGNVKRIADSLREIDREASDGLRRRGPVFRESQLAKDLRGRLEAERAKLLVEGGARARSQLERERGSLRELLEQALRIRIEVSRREREGLEATIAHKGGGPAVRDYRYSAAVSDEHLYWPYDGEFWRDELGTYAYTLTKGCRDVPREAAAAP